MRVGQWVRDKRLGKDGKVAVMHSGIGPGYEWLEVQSTFPQWPHQVTWTGGVTEFRKLRWWERKRPYTG